MKLSRLVAALLVLSPLSALGAEAPEGESLRMDPGQPASVVVITPGGTTATLSNTDIINGLGQAMEKGTNLTVKSLDAQAIEGCEGSFSCFARSARSEAGVGDKDEHWLVVVSNVAQENAPDKVAVLLVSTKDAVYIEDLEKGKKTADEIDAEINERAVFARPEPSDISSPEAANAYFAQVVENDFRKPFNDSGNWNPYGEVELQVEESGIEVKMGDRLIGTTRAGLTRIVDVPPGEYQLLLTHPSYEPFETKVVVSKGERATVTAELTEGASGLNAVLRQSTIWGGAAVAVAGAAITLFAIADNPSVSTVCLLPNGAEDCGASSQWRGFGFDDSKAPGFEDPNGGIPVAPLGYSLLGMGASWALGTIFLTDADELPWLPLLIGAGVFGLSFGLSVALDGDSAFDAAGMSP